MDDRQPCGCLMEYRCSRCGRCYVCHHKAIYFEQSDKWMWKNRSGKFKPVIMEEDQ